LKRRFPLDEFDSGRHQQAAAGDGGKRAKQLYPGNNTILSQENLSALTAGQLNQIEHIVFVQVPLAQIAAAANF